MIARDSLGGHPLTIYEEAHEIHIELSLSDRTLHESIPSARPHSLEPALCDRLLTVTNARLVRHHFYRLDEATFLVPLWDAHPSRVTLVGYYLTAARELRPLTWYNPTTAARHDYLGPMDDVLFNPANRRLLWRSRSIESDSRYDKAEIWQIQGRELALVKTALLTAPELRPVPEMPFPSEAAARQHFDQQHQILFDLYLQGEPAPVPAEPRRSEASPGLGSDWAADLAPGISRHRRSSPDPPLSTPRRA